MPMNLRSLDALRGLLATYIVLGHSRWLLWAGHSAWLKHSHTNWEIPIAYGSAILRYGHEAVIVFFALSGFFIHLRAARLLTTSAAAQTDALRFYRRRAHRLVAPYALALGFTIILDVVGRHYYPTLYSATTGDSLLDWNFSRSGYSAAAIAPALLLLPSSLEKDFGTNSPLWALAFEVIYYLLYPAWLIIRRKGPLMAYGVTALACVALTLLPYRNFFTSVVTSYPVWLGGAALAEFLTRVPGLRINPLVAGGVFLAAFAAKFLIPIPAFSILLSAPFGSACVLAFAAMPESVSVRRWHRFLEAIGIRSYTIYITHFPILVLISAWAFDVFGGRPLSGWLAVGGTLITIGLSWLCFEVCERRFLHRPVA